MSSSHFLNRAEKEITHKLSAILLEIKDPRLDGRMAISRVVLSADLSHLKVYVFINEDSERQYIMLKALKKAIPFLRRRLGESVRFKRIPAIKIFHDRTPEDAANIEAILSQLQDGGELGDEVATTAVEADELGDHGELGDQEVTVTAEDADDETS